MRANLAMSLVLASAVVATAAFGDPDCKAIPKSDPAWSEIDRQYAKLERATLDGDATALFALYAPEFEAHMSSGEVWKLSESKAYTSAAFAQVKQNIHLSNTIIGALACGSGQVKVTVVQQWERMQDKAGRLRRCETTAVQDETWVRTPDGWRRKLIDNIRPAAWYVDGQRIDNSKPYSPDAPPFDPHGLLESAPHPPSAAHP